MWSYSALIKGYVQKSDLQAALELLQEMKQAHGVLPNEVGCTVLLQVCCMDICTVQSQLQSVRKWPPSTVVPCLCLVIWVSHLC